MAKNRRKASRRRRNFVAIPFTETLGLGTLASQDVLGVGATSALAEDLFVISCHAVWALRDPTAGEGPLAVGIAHGDLSDAEIKEALEVEIIDPDDVIARERARRPVRRAGLFQVAVATAERLADGQLVKTPARFVLGDGKALKLWVHNRSGAVLTTGASLVVDGTIFGRWLR